MPKGIYLHKGHKISEETRKKISLALTGKKLSEDHVKKLSEAHKGQIVTEATKKKLGESLKLQWASGKRSGVGKKISETITGKPRIHLRGEKNAKWLGEKVSYRNLHRWVERELGKPGNCENCGKDGLSGREIQWANKSHEYKRVLGDWLRLCVKCHRKYDFHQSIL